MPDFFLSEESYRRLMEIADRFDREGSSKQQRGRPNGRASTLVAKVPPSGIPPLTLGSPDTPGAAYCEIYRLVTVGTSGGGEAEVEAMGFSDWVFNLSTSRIESRYTLIHENRGGEISGFVAINNGLEEQTGTGTFCVVEIDGNRFDELHTETNPSYVIGIDANGCLVKVPVGVCPP